MGELQVFLKLKRTRPTAAAHSGANRTMRRNHANLACWATSAGASRVVPPPPGFKRARKRPTFRGRIGLLLGESRVLDSLLTPLTWEVLAKPLRDVFDVHRGIVQVRQDRRIGLDATICADVALRLDVGAEGAA